MSSLPTCFETPQGRTELGADAVAGIAQTIFLLRGRRVILDSSLAAIYGVETRTLNQAVKRNSGRFPDDFRFQLIDSEVLSSRSQIVILNRTRGTNVKFLPYAFTEHGAIMAATVLNSPRAVEMSIYVVRAFVQLHTILASNAELALRLERLESGIEKRLTSHDEAIAAMFSAIRFQGRAKAALEVHGARLGTKRREPGLPP